MKKILIIFILILKFTVTFATPNYPDGIPDIGSLKGGITFWGQNPDGSYFDGVSYEGEYKINFPNFREMTVYFDVKTYINGGNNNDKNIFINFKTSIKDFTGKIIIEATNFKGEISTKDYQFAFQRDSNYSYEDFFDFSGIKENDKVIMKLILDNGKTLNTRLKKSLVKDWISVWESFGD